MSTQYKASAPGSLMLLGEYAVLSGKQALVCAVDKRISVTLTSRTDATIHITSCLHGEYSTTIHDVELAPNFEFVLAVFKHFNKRLKTGCDVVIQSEFSDKIGFGSSAAVTAATLSAVVNWLGMRFSTLDLLREAKMIIRAVQGVGSGADVAASIFGGMISYQSKPLFAEKYAVTHPIVVAYSGYKTKTVDAIQIVKKRFEEYPALLNNLYNTIGQCVIEGVQAVQQENWTKLGEMMELQQGVMESLGVSAPVLRQMLAELRDHTSVMGAKLSGAGLGDCVVGLGTVPKSLKFSHHDQGVKLIPVDMTLQGVHCEKI